MNRSAASLLLIATACSPAPIDSPPPAPAPSVNPPLAIPDPPPPPEAQPAFPRDPTCQPVVQTAAGYAVTYCAVPDADGVSGDLEVTIQHSKRPVFIFRETKSRYLPLKPLEIIANSRFVGLRYGNDFCSEAKVIDTEKRRVALNSGCLEGAHFEFKWSAKGKPCRIGLNVSEASKKAHRLPKKLSFDVCGNPVDLAAPAQPSNAR